MNKALEILYNEHSVIKSVISLRKKISALSVSDPAKFREIISVLVDFFRNYADKYHHYKEERLLFPLMCERNELLESSIVQEMLDNHSDFRSLVKQIETAADSGNYDQSCSQLNKYTEMLLDHIAVEDEELFQMAETLFDADELEKLYFDFEDIDRELGIEFKRKYEKQPEELTSILGSV